MKGDNCRKCGHAITGKNAMRWGSTSAGRPVYICAACRRAWDRDRKQRKLVESVCGIQYPTTQMR